ACDDEWSQCSMIGGGLGSEFAHFSEDRDLATAAARLSEKRESSGHRARIGIIGLVDESDAARPEAELLGCSAPIEGSKVREAGHGCVELMSSGGDSGKNCEAVERHVPPRRP